jgi:hypothetical protein
MENPEDLFTLALACLRQANYCKDPRMARALAELAAAYHAKAESLKTGNKQER